MPQSCNTPPSDQPEKTAVPATTEAPAKPQRQRHQNRPKQAPQKKSEPGVQMSLTDLKKKPIEELIEMAATLGIA